MFWLSNSSDHLQRSKNSKKILKRCLFTCNYGNAKNVKKWLKLVAKVITLYVLSKKPNSERRTFRITNTHFEQTITAKNDN